MAAPDRWDEACFAVPAVRALVASGLGVGILCQQEQREFWESLENLSVVDFPIKEKPRTTAISIAGNWQASLAWEPGHAAEAFKAAGIPRRLGPNDRKLVKFLTHPLKSTPGPLEHRVRHYLTAVEELGIQTAIAGFFAPALPGISPASGPILLCPDSDFGPNHEWPLDRWEEIARQLLELGKPICVAEIASGRQLAGKLSARLGAESRLIPATRPAAILRELSAYGCVVAADGTLPHLAAHAGATCITLFGPNDPAWKRPLGTRHTVIRRHVECAPCLLPKCPLDMRCQNELDVERVWQAVLGRLGGI